MTTAYPVVGVYIGAEEDREKWLAWRDKWPCAVKASTVPDWFGFGYVSRQKRIAYESGAAVEPPINAFGRLAVDHGRSFEWRGAQCAMQLLEGQYAMHQHQAQWGVHSPSFVLRMPSNIHVIGTPDLVLDVLDDNGPYLPVEVKCPYYSIQKLGLDAALEDFCANHPRGRPKAFLQCAVYALMFGAPVFWTCFYFTDTAHSACVLCEFRMTPKLKYLLETGMQEYRDAIASGKAGTVKRAMRDNVLWHMQDAFVQKYVQQPDYEETIQ